MAKFMFVSDLDNTLVGNDSGLVELNQVLEQHRAQYGTVIIYSTGRSLTLYNQLRQEVSMLDPDILVLSVGTVIYRDGGKHLDETWAEKLSQNWNRDEIVAAAAHFADLVMQPTSEQTPHKISYFISEPAAQEVMPRLEASLSDRGFAVQFVYSSGKDLDILPKAGNKGAATNYLQASLGMTPERTVVCGDSGNDLSLFQQVNGKGIIVGNAKPELLQWHQANPSGDRYLARAHCAAGILEGLRQFGLLED